MRPTQAVSRTRSFAFDDNQRRGTAEQRAANRRARVRPARSLRLEVHRHAADAIAQMRRRRAVLEDVAEVAAAAAAMHFGAHHAVVAVGRGLDRPGDRIVEARPAGAALEFLLGDEQLLAAAGAGEFAGALLVIERA